MQWFCRPYWVGERGFPEEPEADVASDDCHQEERKDEALEMIVSAIDGIFGL
jgi:hypothetical protein